MLTVLLAVAALAAFAAGGAQAAWMIKGEEWTTTETVKAKDHKNVAMFLRLNEVVFTKFELEATGFECVGCTITKGTTASAGKLKLTGVTLHLEGSAFPQCTVNGGTALESLPLKDEAIMDPLAGSEVVFDKFAPVTGTKVFSITFSGSKCPIAEEEIPVKGTLCGELMKEEVSGVFNPVKTNELLPAPLLYFSPEKQETGGCSLPVTEKKDAQLLAVIDTELSGPNAGRPWGVG